MALHRPSRDGLVFSAAVAVAVAHALDDAFVGRQPGVPLGQHAVATLVSVVLAALAVLAFPRVRPGLRAALAIALGVPALVNGALHVVHISFEGPDHSDVTGVLACAAGVVLIGLGASIPWRHRAERPASARRRWSTRVVAVPVAALAAFVLVLPVAMGVVETHKPREAVGAPPSAAYRTVAFSSTDGLRLSGWYRPTRNGATVLVEHGGGSDRTGALRQAKLLDRHGYGVLLYDHRGRGDSEGSPNGYGWEWEKDAAGALRFLHARPEVRRGKLGALGLSSGADTAIDAAGTRDDLDAVVADGAALRTFEDARRIDDEVTPSTPSGWLMFQAVRAFTGSAPSRPLEDLVAESTAPLLLISAGSGIERDANVLFARAADGRAEHWNVPDARHTGIARSHPAAYEQRVGAFFDRELLGG